MQIGAKNIQGFQSYSHQNNSVEIVFSQIQLPTIRQTKGGDFTRFDEASGFQSLFMSLGYQFFEIFGNGFSETSPSFEREITVQLQRELVFYHK